MTRRNLTSYSGKNLAIRQSKKKIEQLIADIIQHPFTGIGKPEPLKYNLINKWSRRINGEHRIIYEVNNNIIHIHSLRGHYS